MKDKIAFTILRVGLGVVFLIFGIGKFQDDIWAQTIRSMEVFQGLPWDVGITVFLVGVSEVVAGTFLILGVFTRIFSAIASLQLLVILFLLQFQEIRDFGLLGAAIYMALVKDESFGFNRILACCFNNKTKTEA
ncbi:MAG: DoxX family protein [Candidatus Omnitrophica bacterium]|nr:DoxX family protein [Candidatus Omnitrophota bacterium]